MFVEQSESLCELRARVEREQELLSHIEDVQTSLDKKAYVQGTEVLHKLYQWIYNTQKQVGRLKAGFPGTLREEVWMRLFP